MNIISSVLLVLGALVLLVGTIGTFKFKDFLSRTHAVSVVDTFATLLIIIALMVNYGFTLFSLKLLLILIFLYITGSTAIHALTQAYLKSKSKGELK
ncbi:MAG: sodium:proton antiporter [Gammaproteobacteria bacterium]|nr:sodium:proton antiporter [Gammaproteobacteria bacterium]|tara:strand:- start:2377 stop:2667 length:291 start_codon:yes stop_codon:yes gene_type:complete